MNHFYDLPIEIQEHIFFMGHKTSYKYSLDLLNFNNTHLVYSIYTNCYCIKNGICDCKKRYDGHICNKIHYIMNIDYLYSFKSDNENIIYTDAKIIFNNNDEIFHYFKKFKLINENILDDYFTEIYGKKIGDLLYFLWFDLHHYGLKDCFRYNTNNRRLLYLLVFDNSYFYNYVRDSYDDDNSDFDDFDDDDSDSDDD